MMQDFHQPGGPVADFLFNWLPFAGTALVAVFGCAMLVCGFAAFAKAAALRKWGVRGTAVVTRKWIKKGYVEPTERNRTAPLRYHFLQFERREGDRMVTAKEVAPIAQWRDVEPGSTVDVIYLPRGSLMRLAGWSHTIGQGAGLFQLVVGALMTSAGVSMMLVSAFSAMNAPEPRVIGPEWEITQAEVLRTGAPADPYLRLFAPDTRLLQVVFGDTRGGASMANQRVVRVTPEQTAGQKISEGDILKAWMNPEDEYDAVLDLERDRGWR